MKLKRFSSTVLAAVISFATLAFAVGCADEEKNAIKVNFSQVMLSCLGDSITDERSGIKYPMQLKTELGLGAVNNYGSSGATLSGAHKSAPTNTLLNQYPKIDEDSNIVSVMAGVNDFKYHHVPLGQKGDTGSETFYGGLEQLITGIKKRCPDAYIFFMTPYKCTKYDEANNAGHVLADYVNAIIDMCEEYDIDYINFFVDGGFDFNNPMHTADGLHPLERFYEEYTTPALVKFIRTNYTKFYREQVKNQAQA